MDFRVGALDLIEHVANLSRRHGRVGKELDEFDNRALEIDVVLPESIVGIHNQVLAIHLAVRGARRNGISKTASTSTGMPSRRAGSNCHFANASAALRSRRSSRWRMSA